MTDRESMDGRLGLARLRFSMASRVAMAARLIGRTRLTGGASFSSQSRPRGRSSWMFRAFPEYETEVADMKIDRASAFTLILGSVLFLIAAFSPISRVFGTADAARKLEMITSAPLQWTMAQLLFGLGSLVTAAGVAMLASRNVSARLYASAALMGAGALL